MKGALFCSGSFPIAQGQAANDQPVNIGFWIGFFVPDALNRRILPSCHPVDRVIFTGDVDYHSASAFAAKLTLRPLAWCLKSIKQEQRNRGCAHPHCEQQNCLDEQFHAYAPRSGFTWDYVPCQFLNERNFSAKGGLVS